MPVWGFNELSSFVMILILTCQKPWTNFTLFLDCTRYHQVVIIENSYCRIVLTGLRIQPCSKRPGPTFTESDQKKAQVAANASCIMMVIRLVQTFFKTPLPFDAIQVTGWQVYQDSEELLFQIPVEVMCISVSEKGEKKKEQKRGTSC